jgi:hypothetical protein
LAVRPYREISTTVATECASIIFGLHRVGFGAGARHGGDAAALFMNVIDAEWLNVSLSSVLWTKNVMIGVLAVRQAIIGRRVRGSLLGIDCIAFDGASLGANFHAFPFLIFRHSA